MLSFVEIGPVDLKNSSMHFCSSLLSSLEKDLPNKLKKLEFPSLKDVF